MENKIRDIPSDSFMHVTSTTKMYVSFHFNPSVFFFPSCLTSSFSLTSPSCLSVVNLQSLL